LGVRFGFPINERDAYSLGLTYDNTEIELGSDSPIRYRQYCGNISGCTNDSLLLNLGWSHDTRDNVLFPNVGVFQRLSGELALPGLDLEYYKLDYRHSWYSKISENMTLLLNGELGYADSYGNQDFPFFKNYFLGGVNNVRGYDNGTIGPKEINPSDGDLFAVGGTGKVLGNVELFFPVPGIKDSKQFRLSTFFDAGAIYADSAADESEDFRYSAGLGVSWISPFGPLKLVLAKALNPQDDDETQIVQFQFGQQF
jgi:outer membrane protein insertion porin family